MKGSQAYTEEFGRAVADAYVVGSRVACGDGRDNEGPTEAASEGTWDDAKLDELLCAAHSAMALALRRGGRRRLS